MTTQHTPGPWRLFNVNRTTAVMSGEGSHNEVVHWSGFDASDFPKQTVANARLIAAAPDLLATLIECGEYMGEPMQMTRGNIQAAVVNALIRNIHAAIAKATQP